MPFIRTKAQVSDLRDDEGNPADLVMVTDGAGGFTLGAGGGHLTGTLVIYDEDSFIGVFEEIRFIGAGVQVFNSGTYAAIAITGSAGGSGANGSGSYPTLAYVTGSNATDRTYTANNTWETDIYCTGSFSVDRDCDLHAVINVQFMSNNSNWEYYLFRLLIDGAAISPVSSWGRQQNVGKQANENWFEHQTYTTSLSSGTHTFVYQNMDINSGNDRIILHRRWVFRAYHGGTKWINFD